MSFPDLARQHEAARLIPNTSSTAIMSYQHSSNPVRTLWQGFVKNSTGTRNATEHKIRAATAKADEGARAGIAKDIQEKSFRSLRTQWQSQLDKAGLNDADWVDITEAEKEAVITILGEVEADDDDECPASSQMPPTAYPYPLAPSFSSSTRSTNISSASSYAVVSPNELYSEDDGDPFMSPLMVPSNPFCLFPTRANFLLGLVQRHLG